MTIRLVCLDADDTLWHNESFFQATQDRFCALLEGFADPAVLRATLADVEHRNLTLYGYGAKGFALSMIEAALELTGGQVSTAILGDILTAGREMLRHPVDTLPGVPEALVALAGRARLVLVTKGDLFHQEAKLAASGLGDHFAGVEIVSDKTPATYARIFAHQGVAPHEAVMAGNSVRSDVLPPLAAGGWAALVPYPLVWQHEAADAPIDHPRFVEVETLAGLVEWLDDAERVGAGRA